MMTTTTTPPPTRPTRVHFEDLLDIAPANDVDRRWPDPMVGVSTSAVASDLAADFATEPHIAPARLELLRAVA